MKLKFAFAAAVMILSLQMYSQTKVSVINAENRSITKTEKYDSLENINSSNLESLIGQYVYFIPDKESEEGKTYQGITTWSKIPQSIEEKYGSAVYAPIKDKYDKVNTSYFALCDKSFEIEGYVPKNKNNFYPLLILRVPDNNEKIYLEYYYGLSNPKNMVVMGYYEKMKNLNIGKIFLPKGNSYLYNLEDSKPVNLSENDSLKCIDVVFAGNDSGNPCLVFSSKSGGKYYAYKDYLYTLVDLEEKAIMETRHNLMMEENEKEIAIRKKEMIKKYGKTIGTIVGEGKVRIGFNRQMCEDAWGKPKKINKTTSKYGTSEQWVYDGSYLYFENGKLETIQN